MPCKAYLSTLCAASALLFVAAAGAGDEHMSKGHDKMSMMDANGDGRVTAEEHAAGAAKMFKEMDADSDGRVTAKEMDAMHAKMAKEHMGKDGDKDAAQAGKYGKEKSSAAKIAMMDKDHDGLMSAKEHEAGAKEMFGKMDSDKDGSLSAGEIETGHRKMMTAEDR
jgi:Ca2+-binding EF-hand superfamily protein